MKRAIICASGRADISPLGPVRHAMEQKGFEIDWRVFPDGPEHGDYDVAVLLGDRFEIATAAVVLTVFRVPIAHIHGGEETHGSFDNQLRDAISKLAHIHFVAHDAAAKRLATSLGEDDRRIHVVGAPGLDRIAGAYEPHTERDPFFLATYHPATLGEKPEIALKAMQAAFELFPDYDVIWTGSNNDPGYEIIEQFARHVDLSDGDYIQAAYRAAALVGNSSSYIIEGPAFQTPTVNIGTRQFGRLRGPSIEDVFLPDADSIAEALRWAIDYKGPWDNPYGGPGASQKIADILAEVDLAEILVK